MNTLFEYVRQAFVTWVATLVGTVGFITSVVDLVPGLELKTATAKVLTGLVCFIVSIIVTLIIKPFRKTVENLPLHGLLFSDNCCAKILFPFKDKYLKSINKIANGYYGKSNANIQIVKAWYAKNPLVVVTLADRHNKIIGYYDILPLKDDFAREFIEGRVTEKEILPSHILPPEEMSVANYLYFAGVAVKDIDEQRNKMFGGYLLFSAYVYLNKYYDLSTDRIIFAVAATKCGEVILKHLGYSIETSGDTRKDDMDLYLKTINRKSIDDAKDKLNLLDKKLDCSDLTNYYLPSSPSAVPS